MVDGLEALIVHGMEAEAAVADTERTDVHVRCSRNYSAPIFNVFF